MIDNALYVDGKVVLYYYQPIPKYIKVNGKDYLFSCEHSVSLAFVDEADVPALLSHKGGCCGGQKNVIFLATQVLYSHWVDGGGGR